MNSYSLFVPVLVLIAGACSNSTPGNPPSDTTAKDASSQDAPALEESAAPEGSTPDGSIDAGSTGGGDDASEGAATPTCGAPPARFTVLAGADAGLVRDNMTELVWMGNSVGGGEPPQTQTDAATYCTDRGMRLPTESEALALAAAYAPCAFGQWSTWTSTVASAGDAWVIDYAGDASPQLADNFPSAVLCVRGPTGD